MEKFFSSYINNFLKFLLKPTLSKKKKKKRLYYLIVVIYIYVV